MKTHLFLACLAIHSLFSTLATSASECGRLEKGDTFSDANKIFDCLESRLELVASNSRNREVVTKSRVEVTSESQHSQNNLTLVSQGCKRGKQYYECRVFIKNIGAERKNVVIRGGSGILIGANGDAYSGYNASFLGQTTFQNLPIQNDLISGEGSNIVFNFENITDPIEPVSIRVSISHNDSNTATQALLKL